MEIKNKRKERADRFQLFYIIILNKCEKLINHDEKINFIKKIINECNNIIELLQTQDCHDFEPEFLREYFPDIDKSFFLLLNISKKEKRIIYTKHGLSKIDFTNVKNCPYGFDHDSFVECLSLLHNALTECADKLPKSSKEYSEEETVDYNSGTVSISDRVRMFEPAKKVGILPQNTHVKKLMQLYSNDSETVEKDIHKYNATFNRIRQFHHAPNSNLIIEYIKELCVFTLKGKTDKIEELIDFLEKQRTITF